MAAANNNESSVPLLDVLGPKIILNNQDEISVAELARTKKTIVLYFSAHWCPPCRGFTPTLSKAYAEYKSSRSSGNKDCPEDDGFELVFVSSDRNAEAFREYHSEMSFPALPYESRDLKAKLGEKFQVNGIPHLVAIDASTGEESSVNATVGDLRSFVIQNGAAAFPLCPSHVQKMKEEGKKKQADALQKLKEIPIIVSVPPSSSMSTTSEPAAKVVEKKDTIELSGLLEQHEYVGLVFGDGDKGDATYDKIQEAAEKLHSKKFIPVYVGWTEYRDQSDHSALWERFYSVREEELTDEVRSTLRDVAGKSIDGLTMVTIKSSGSGLCGLDGNCEPSGVPVIATIDEGLRALRQFGPAAFPWDEAAIKNALLVKERRVSGLKERLVEFGFLRFESAGNESNSLLLRGTSNNEEDNEDKKKCVAVDNLLSSNDADEDDSTVLGLYFSAHWCPPCRAFTPELLKAYEEIRSKRGVNSFEVVFVSFDNDERDFKEYYSSMVSPTKKEQWLSLDYSKSRELATDLAEVFGVRGFPTLVLLKRDGTILSNNARGSVSEYGADCFPWDAASIQMAEDELLKKEEEDVDSQRKQGDGIVVRRIVGPIGSIKYDASNRVVEFSNTFSTAVLDETIVTQGVLFYEAEILTTESTYSITQFGFALRDAFQQKNERSGSGVGDNGKSWGVCGFRKELWHDDASVPIDDSSSNCAWEIGDVIGFAVNVDAGKIAISKNGNWSKAAGCGVVFKNHSLKEVVASAGGIHPGLTGSGLKIRLNVRKKDFRFSKPSEEVWQFVDDVPSEKDNIK